MKKSELALVRDRSVCSLTAGVWPGTSGVREPSDLNTVRLCLLPLGIYGLMTILSFAPLITCHTVGVTDWLVFILQTTTNVARIRGVIPPLPITPPWHGAYLKHRATGSTIGVLGFYSWRGLGIFLFTTASRTALGTTQPPIQWVPGAISLRVKRPGSISDHLPPSSTEVKEWVELYLHSPNTPSLRGFQLKHRDNFTFYLYIKFFPHCLLLRFIIYQNMHSYSSSSIIIINKLIYNVFSAR
jgi:hypothetical protein